MSRGHTGSEPLVASASRVTCLAALILLCGQAAAAVYYVGGTGGSDRASGLSPAEAWQTLAPVKAAAFGAGDALLLRAGQTFAAPLALRVRGSTRAPFRLGRYGAGPAPHLVGTPGDEAVLTLRDSEYCEVSGLELSGARTGVFLYLKDCGVGHHVYFRGLAIHDIRGSLGGDDGGFLCKREGEDTWFEDLRIEDCTVERADRNGILLTDYPTASDKHHSRGVVVRGNRLRDLGGDGIFILGCDGAVIERNVVQYAHQRVGREPGMRACAGIWPHRCNDTLIQYNEVSHTAVGGKTVWDSEGFDDDLGCRRTVFQYNYSHDNAGGFLLICGGRDTIARYNISQNDGVATFSIEGDGSRHLKVYNNTVYIGPQGEVSFARNTFGTPRGALFANNLLYARGKLRYEFGGLGEVRFTHNAYFGQHAGRPEDPAPVTADPLLPGPGSGGEGRDSLRGYVPPAGSPLIGAGWPAPGRYADFFAVLLPAGLAPTVGACNASR